MGKNMIYSGISTKIEDIEGQDQMVLEASPESPTVKP